MPGTLTFEQVKEARVFAWHERFYLFAGDMLLRVVVPHDPATERQGPAMCLKPSALRGTEHLLDEGWHHLDGCVCPYCSTGDSAPTLDFEQIKEARIFAWHERRYLFAGGSLLGVVTREQPAVDATRYDPLAMVVRPSVLRGTEHLLDEGWHHLDGCWCRHCSTGHSEARPRSL